MTDSLSLSYDKQVGRFLDKGSSEGIARVKKIQSFITGYKKDVTMIVRVLSKLVSPSQTWTCIPRGHKHPNSRFVNDFKYV